MASAAIQQVQQIQKSALNSEYEGKLSNQFVDELKCSTLFQADWSELIGAAPTALSLMGSLWIAAADPKAEKISMVKSMPTGGFKYITNRAEPTLRSCLVDVCNNGGRMAFTKAGANMDALQIISKRICDERIYMVFQRLGPCTKGQDELEDFNDALTSFNQDAKRCAALATETREAFTRWGLMVGELHACTEAESGRTSIQKEATKIDEEVTKVQEKFAINAKKDVEDQVKKADEALKRAEKRLDTAIDKIPGPLENLVTGLVGGFTQALPSIVSAAIPAVMAAVNPAGAATSAISGALSNSVKQNAGTAVAGGPAGGANGTNGSAAAPGPVPAVIDDPAYAAAITIRELTNHFYEYLGGDAGPIDMSKFGSADGAEGGTQGVSYFLGTLQSQQSTLEVTNTDANKKLRGVYANLLKVTQEIQKHLADQNGIADVKLPPQTLAAWKKLSKQAKEDVLQLATAASAASSGSVPNPYANVKTGPGGNSAQNAQLNTAMQGVQMAQSAVDAKQDAYDAAIAKQAKTAAAMAEIQEKLKRLQEQGKTLDEIKSVLRSCISVLVDLSVQIAKIEQFFTMLSTVIDNIIMVRAADFTAELSKAGRRSLANGKLKIDDLAKATIYSSTLQLKGYFSLLSDISTMYSQVDKPYVRQGLDLCSMLSKGAASGDSTAQMQEQLTTYMNESGAAVAKIVKDKQEEIRAGLRDRIRKAAETTRMVEEAVAAHGLPVDQGAKAAIQAGADAAKEDAKKQIDATMGNGETVSSEDTDANGY
ncbi:hypothetical protein B0H66DRAFT_624251 [Apodospora peruviana]|uniref:Uncharacterized protein n=1 Tax=Apodospora peruviana TaxID=516989 RepID=A0AAE0I6E1_9PEZI|nr:hypothetical protein B0H66DRAFT_624251 [Apodospora peruviana]